MLELLTSPLLKEKSGERRISKEFARVDASGRLVLSDDLKKKFGLTPGQEVYLEVGENSLRLHRSLALPSRIYVEPTTRCNMACDMCQRHTWDHGPGDMTPSVFQRIMEALDACDPVPAVVFGGFGEPLLHPDILAFVEACKKRGADVEIITNGLLLNRDRIQALKVLGLDRLWVSVDGVSDYCGGHVRDSGAFNRLVTLLKAMTANQYYGGDAKPKLGFVFVAMKDNIHEFPAVMALARSLNVDRVLVSNLLPYTRDGLDQILYPRSTWKLNERVFQVSLPRLDVKGEALGVLLKAMADQDMTDFMDRSHSAPLDACPFIRKGSLAVGQDGSISPCPPLLHTHACFFQGVERKNRECSFGNLKDRALMDIWKDPEYAAFRKRVMAFDFSPCVSCASCEWSEANEKDCTGNTFPACGGCLWAQGLVQCP
jgi:MoaA/NifB/PqqE/SkfB family radical SAM enzyme